MSWRDDAACAGKPTAWFFGQDVSRGLEVCRGCPVRTECAAEGEKRGEYGVWGGRNRTPTRYSLKHDPRQCRECAEWFTPQPGPGTPALYCSDGCRSTARRRKQYASAAAKRSSRPARCPVCGDRSQRRNGTCGRYVCGRILRNRKAAAVARLCEDGGPGAAPTARGLDATCVGGLANGGR